MTRYKTSELIMDFTGRFVFLRINPDPFKEHGQRRDPPFEQRLKEAESTLTNILEQVEDCDEDDTQDLVQVSHLFYDT